MRFVLYVNFWGTLEKIRGAVDGDPLFQRSDLRSAQARFAQVLREAAEVHPECRVAHVSDTAYVSGNEVDPLLRFAARSFQAQMRTTEGGFKFWPLRGAIARDAGPLSPQDLMLRENIWSLRLDGEAPVEAANLEKSAQKGVRLFLTESAAETASALPLRACETRGLRHYEANWMTGPGRDDSYLTPETRAFLAMATQSLHGRGGNYPRQTGASVDDLVDWSTDCSVSGRTETAKSHP